MAERSARTLMIVLVASVTLVVGVVVLLVGTREGVRAPAAAGPGAQQSLGVRAAEQDSARRVAVPPAEDAAPVPVLPELRPEAVVAAPRVDPRGVLHLPRGARGRTHARGTARVRGDAQS